MNQADRLVLIVDDDYDIRDSLHDVLTDEGYDVAFAPDGLEALDYLRTQRRPALILLDWMMPRCDGATFRAKQLQDPEILDIPVVLLTADANIDVKTQQLSAQGGLRKPVDLRLLMAEVRRHCP